MEREVEEKRQRREEDTERQTAFEIGRLGNLLESGQSNFVPV